MKEEIIGKSTVIVGGLQYPTFMVLLERKVAKI